MKRPALGLVVLLAGLAACSEAPTEPVINCAALALGAPLSFTVTSAAALRPALEDARDRVLPTLAAPPAVDIGLASLERAVATADRAAACTAFNATVTAFNALASDAAPEDAPDVEVLRLTLQFARTWIISG